MTLTLTAAEQAVLIAIFEQIDLSKIDKEKLQADLGSPTKNATSKRVTRLREKLNSWARAGVASATMFTAAEQSVLIGIFGQVDFGQVDKSKLQVDLGLPSKNAAGKRVSRLREKLSSRAESGSSSSHNATPASLGKKKPQSNKKLVARQTMAKDLKKENNEDDVGSDEEMQDFIGELDENEAEGVEGEMCASVSDEEA